MSTKIFKGLQSQVNMEETKKKNKTKHHKQWATHSTLKAQHWSMQLLAKPRFWYPSWEAKGLLRLVFQAIKAEDD